MKKKLYILFKYLDIFKFNERIILNFYVKLERPANCPYYYELRAELQLISTRVCS